MLTQKNITGARLPTVRRRWAVRTVRTDNGRTVAGAIVEQPIAAADFDTVRIERARKRRWH